MITVKSDDGVHARGRHTQIMEDWDLWFDSRDPNQASFVESYLKLTPQFFKHIAESLSLINISETTRPRLLSFARFLFL